jgi:hypothetical protein
MKSPLNLWSSGISSNDSNIFKYVALLMSKGGMPYKDTFDHKGPLLYIINYLGNLLSYYRGIWIIELISLSVFTFALYKIARLSVNKLLSCFLVLFILTQIGDYFEGGNLSEEYALPFIAVSLFIFLDYFINNRISTCRLIICGFSFSAVLMLRANMVSIWIVFCLAVLFKSLKENKVFPVRFLLFFLIGCAIMLLPLFIWLIHGNAFADFINTYFVFNREYIANQRDENAFGIFPVLKLWFDSPMCLLSLIATFFLLYTKKNVRINVIYLIYEICTLILISMSGKTFMHYGLILLPMYIYPVSALIQYINSHERSRSVTLLFLLYLTINTVYPVWADNIGNAVATWSSPAESLAVDDDTRNLLNQIESSTSESDPIQVIGNYDFIYVASHRLSASKYSYQIPVCSIDPKMYTEFQNDLKTKRPLLVVLQNYRDPAYIEYFSTINNYELIYATKDGLGLYRLKR